MRELTNAQRLAIAVLTGDQEAIPLLLDLVAEETGLMDRSLPARHEVKVPLGRLRAVVTAHEGMEPSNIDIDGLRQKVSSWLRGATTEDKLLVLYGCRLELYELPENFNGR